MSTTTQLGWSSYIQRYEEASDLENDLQGDVANIESGSAAQAVQGWEDLSQSIYQNANWQDLLKGSGGEFAKSYIGNVANAAQNYMESITLQVQQPNSPGNYINLYAGTSSIDGDGNIDEDFDETTTDSEGYTVAVPANLFEMIEGKYTNLINDAYDAYFDNPGGYGPGLWTDWSLHGNLSFNCEWDGSGTDNGEYCSASGSLQQWMPFIHLNGGDPSALNAALQG